MLGAGYVSEALMAHPQPNIVKCTPLPRFSLGMTFQVSQEAAAFGNVSLKLATAHQN